MSSRLTQPLRLACGTTLPHRIAKAAMTEGLSDPRQQPTDRHARLYRRWAEGGAGLLVTGNVMVDRRYLERPGNVVLEPGDASFRRPPFEEWARSVTDAGRHVWMQLNHGGRQVPSYVNPNTVAPSSSAIYSAGGMFGKARELRVEEIAEIIERFAFAAGIAKDCGFTGVQVHSAHGYLLSEFLSPRINRREDKWGGSLENRAKTSPGSRARGQARVGPSFPISVKLNSADFQRGGFDSDDCLQVIRWLENEGIDLLEISGGTYEQPQMFAVEGIEPAVGKRASTRAREAYFIEFAAEVRHISKIPLMVTGGFRSHLAMEEALESGEVDVIGMARPLCIDPTLPRKLLEHSIDAAPAWADRLRIGPGFLSETSPVLLIRAANVLGVQGWHCLQILHLADDQEPDGKMGALRALVTYARNELRAAKRMERRAVA